MTSQNNCDVSGVFISFQANVSSLSYLPRNATSLQLARGANRRGHKAEVGAANGKSMGTLKCDPLPPGKDGIPELQEALSCAGCWSGGWMGNQASGPGVYINLLSCLGRGWGADPVG